MKPTVSRNSLLDDDDDEDEESVVKNDNSGEEEHISFNSPGKEEDAGLEDTTVGSSSALNEKESSTSKHAMMPQSQPEIRIDDANNSNNNKPGDTEPEVLPPTPSNDPTANADISTIDIDTLSAYASHRTNTHNEDVEVQCNRL